MNRTLKKFLKVTGIILGIIMVFVLVGVVVLPKMMFPEFEPLKVTGNHQVENALYTWVDESRVETFSETGENRALTIKFWYPEEAGSYPLVVFSHGAFGVIDSNNSTYTELASNGYVVASIGHPYHAMFVEDAYGKTTMVDMDFATKVYTDNGGEYSEEAERKVYDFSVEWMETRSADMNFVIDTILEKAKKQEGAPFTSINADCIGLIGHSMGGATAVEVGRTRKDIDAVIDLEGTMAGEYVGFENGYEVYDETPYPIPVLDINSRVVREQIDALSGQHEGWIYVNDYVGQRAADYREIIFEDAGHLNFTDLPLFSPMLAKLLGVGAVDARECMEHVNEVVLTYFDYYLKQKGSLDTLQAVY